MKQVAVIGAGASGIIASLFAAKKKDNIITLFEKQNKIGVKVLNTGNGRCNISNKYINLPNYHGHYPEWAMNVFSKFGLQDTLKYFESIGIPVIEEDNGRLFPASMQASSVVELFNYELNRNGVNLRLNRKVEKVIPDKNRFRIITAGKEELFFDSVILSAGSCAGPGNSSSKDGYELASSLGHRIYDPFPAILPVNIPLKIIHTLEGIKWVCKVIVEHEGEKISESTGELLFTKYGISGPAALNISRTVNQSIIERKTPVIVIDFFPELPEDLLTGKIYNLWIDPDKPLLLSLAGLIKKGLFEILLKTEGINPFKLLKELEDGEKKKISRILKSFKLFPGRPRSFKEAVVGAGGIDVNEVNPETMESKIVKNLFLTGELLDIDGDSGGYNLQFAWSTGAIAGSAQ